MTTSTQWQLAEKAAERYQNILTPAILGPFAHALVAFANLQAGEKVLDVGCGTGAAARYAAEVVGSTGHITGLDLNPGMLAVARALAHPPGATIAWREGNAAQLPLPDDSVDVVLCAQTVQFLPDKITALQEMQRVVRPDGRIAFSLWCDITENPYFDVLVRAISRHVGPETAVGLQSAFALTAPNEIKALIQSAGITKYDMTVTQLKLPFPTLATFVPRHVSATPMDAGFRAASPGQQEAVIQEVVAQMERFVRNGRLRIPFRSHMIQVKK